MANISGGSRFKLHFLLDTIIQCNKLGNTKTSVHLGEVGCQSIKHTNENQLDGMLLGCWVMENGQMSG